MYLWAMALKIFKKITGLYKQSAVTGLCVRGRNAGAKYM